MTRTEPVDGVRKGLGCGRQITAKGVYPGSWERFWNFWTFPISRTLEAKNLKFRVWIDYVTYKPVYD